MLGYTVRKTKSQESYSCGTKTTAAYNFLIGCGGLILPTKNLTINSSFTTIPYWPAVIILTEGKIA